MEPKIEEKDGKFRVIMPNGFTTKWYKSINDCRGFLGILITATEVLKIKKG